MRRLILGTSFGSTLLANSAIISFGALSFFKFDPFAEILYQLHNYTPGIRSMLRGI